MDRGDRHRPFSRWIKWYRSGIRNPGALKGVRLSGRFHIKDSAATQRFSTIGDITPTDNVLRIMKKIYDEAALYISGERREQDLFKTSRDSELESSHERANEE